MSRLLVLSNGAGEDAIASKVLQRLPEDLKARVVCCPLVGPGKALSQDFELCGPRVLPPSEGLFRESWALAFKDLARGVIGGHIQQLKFLRSVSERVGLTLAVGDLFPVIWAGFGGSPRTFFIGTAKSIYHHPYSYLERCLLKRLIDQGVVRDQPTAEKLREQGLNVRCLGNAMMDEVQPRGIELPFEDASPVVTLFPGSRSGASSVLSFQLEVLETVRATIPGLQAGVAVAPGMDCRELVGDSREKGWTWNSDSAGMTSGFLSRGDARVYFLSGALGDLLAVSSLALGQAGTANEQAAGAGVPVVAYSPNGEKGLRWYRKRQKGLLGDAVRVVVENKSVIARELVLLLSDPTERARRAEIGRERMGPAGACALMAQAISEMWCEGEAS